MKDSNLDIVKVTSDTVTKADELVTVGKAQAHAAIALAQTGKFAESGDNQRQRRIKLPAVG
jgi:hypothetical protein